MSENVYATSTVAMRQVSKPMSSSGCSSADGVQTLENAAYISSSVKESRSYSSSNAAPETEPPPWFQNSTAVRSAG